MDHLQRLTRAAIRERLGYTVGSDQLIQMALDALMADLDTPALRRLAGLNRNEEAEAHDLFDQVIHELELAPSLPDNPTQARWELVRWWCRLIVDGSLPPEEGGRLIWIEGWEKLGHSPALLPLISSVCGYEDWNEDFTDPRETCLEYIVTDARQLLTGPWPPTNTPDAVTEGHSQS
ncbi:MAG: hypothetical protein WBA97_06900 [Actinophytocola sp.]|uniref:hypothetical protein n=1 Tax=Actinophytocola sp. TaxID=1872138 RepID=UPI003C78A5EC